MKYNLLSLGIIVVCVFGGFLLFRLPVNKPAIPAPPPIVPTSAVSVNQREEMGDPTLSPKELSMDLDAYYQIIIDNNIFRPLNWKPRQRVSAYTLLGTVIATDGSSAKAYIQERESNQFYTVSVGEQVGKMTVRTITPKRVTLTQNGEVLTLSLSRVRFLNYRSNRGVSVQENLPPPIAMKKETSHTVTAKNPSDAAREWRKALEERASEIREKRKRMQNFLQQYENSKAK